MPTKLKWKNFLWFIFLYNKCQGYKISIIFFRLKYLQIPTKSLDAIGATQIIKHKAIHFVNKYFNKMNLLTKNMCFWGSIIVIR